MRKQHNQHCVIDSNKFNHELELHKIKTQLLEHSLFTFVCVNSLISKTICKPILGGIFVSKFQVVTLKLGL